MKIKIDLNDKKAMQILDKYAEYIESISYPTREIFSNKKPEKRFAKIFLMPI